MEYTHTHTHTQDYIIYIVYTHTMDYNIVYIHTNYDRGHRQEIEKRRNMYLVDYC